MTEKKNYCVDGICTTIETEYETICSYFEPCNHECCVKIPDEITYSCHHSASGSFCDSEEANAEYQESQK